MTAGFVKLGRKSFGHWLWKERPYDRWHAWESLWAEKAQFMNGQVGFQGRLFNVTRGQLVTTARQLSREWGWSREKVSGFLAILRKAAMIRTETDQGCLLVSICNYELYQSAPVETGHEPATNRPLTGHRPARDPPPTGHEPATIEERKDLKNERTEEGEEMVRPPIPAGLSNYTMMADAYLRINPGIMSREKAKNFIEFSIARGADPQAVEKMLHDGAKVKGEFIWDLLKEVTPNGGRRKSWINEARELFLGDKDNGNPKRSVF